MQFCSFADKQRDFVFAQAAKQCEIVELQRYTLLEWREWFHAPATLRTEIEPFVSHTRPIGPQIASGAWGKRNILPTQEIEQRFIACTSHSMPGSVVSYSDWLRAGGPGIESRWGRDFQHLSRPALGSTQPPVQWVPGLFRGKERLRRDADPSPPSNAVVKKE